MRGKSADCNFLARTLLKARKLKMKKLSFGPTAFLSIAWILLSFAVMNSTASAACSRGVVLNPQSIGQVGMFDALQCPWEMETLDQELTLGRANPRPVPAPQPGFNFDILSFLGGSERTQVINAASSSTVRARAPQTVRELMARCQTRIAQVMASGHSGFGPTVDGSRLRISSVNRDLINTDEDGWIDAINVWGTYDQITDRGDVFPIQFTLSMSYTQPFSGCDQLSLRLL